MPRMTGWETIIALGAVLALAGCGSNGEGGGGEGGGEGSGLVYFPPYVDSYAKAVGTWIEIPCNGQEGPVCLWRVPPLPSVK